MSSPFQIPPADSATTRPLPPARAKESPPKRTRQECSKGSVMVPATRLSIRSATMQEVSRDVKAQCGLTATTDAQVQQATEAGQGQSSGTPSGARTTLRRQPQPQSVDAGQYLATHPPSPGIVTVLTTLGPRPSPSAGRVPKAHGQPSIRPSHESPRRPTLCPNSWIMPPGKPPSLRPSPGSPRAVGATVKTLTGVGKRVIQIGIETEFLLATRDHRNNWSFTLKDFVMNLAQMYNETVPKRHPRMYNVIRPYLHQGALDKWCLVEETTISGGIMREPWGIELVSPILRALPGSAWREDVETMWKFLQIHYAVSKNDRCATHIHISLDPFFTTLEIKRIAQAIIHFEPAFEALVPDVRRGVDAVKSNWLDSPSLMEWNITRAQLIAAIERELDNEGIVGLLQRPKDRNYSWNLRSLFGKKTIEFRKPPASTTSEEALGWAELAISFIQASVGYESVEKLQRVPATIGGLRWFVSQFTVPGVNEPARMQRIWAGKDMNSVVEPLPNPVGVWHWTGTAGREKVERLKGAAAADAERIRKMAMRAREPYW